jgi:kynureninase
MPDTEVLQPDPGSLRAAAEAAQLAQAISGLVSIDGGRLVDSDPLAPLAHRTPILCVWGLVCSA